MLFEAAAVHCPNAVVNAVDAELVRAEEDNWSIFFVGGKCNRIIPRVISVI